MTVFHHKNDLPAGLVFHNAVAVDTETMGLNPYRDRLCVVQLSAGDGDAHVVQFDKGAYEAPRLKALLQDNSITKIFHFARFDVAVLKAYLGVMCGPLYCTKIASQLARTYTDRHGLKELCKDLLGIELNKQAQSSDWGNDVLSPEQLDYAAQDVLYLHQLRIKLDIMLWREERNDHLDAALNFLPTRALLDLGGWPGDLFAH